MARTTDPASAISRHQRQDGGAKPVAGRLVAKPQIPDVLLRHLTRRGPEHDVANPLLHRELAREHADEAEAGVTRMAHQVGLVTERRASLEQNPAWKNCCTVDQDGRTTM